MCQTRVHDGLRRVWMCLGQECAPRVVRKRLKYIKATVDLTETGYFIVRGVSGSSIYGQVVCRGRLQVLIGFSIGLVRLRSYLYNSN